MKITREALKNIVKETMIEESEYQEFFKRALEKAGKSIPSIPWLISYDHALNHRFLILTNGLYVFLVS